MRPPFSATEPVTRGVVTGVRGRCLSASSRLRPPGRPAGCGAAPGTGTAAGGWPGCGVVEPGCCGGTCCCCCCCCCFCASRCLSSCGMPTKYCQPTSTITDSTMARMVLRWLSIAAFRLRAVQPAKRPFELLHQQSIGGGERRPASDQHVVVALMAETRHDVARGLAQPPADAVPLHGVAGLLGDGIADADGTAVAAVARLRQEGAARRARCPCRREKIRAWRQST